VASSANREVFEVARWSGIRADFWLGLQARYDLEMAEWKEGGRIEREVTPLVTAQHER